MRSPIAPPLPLGQTPPLHHGALSPTISVRRRIYDSPSRVEGCCFHLVEMAREASIILRRRRKKACIDDRQGYFYRTTLLFTLSWGQSPFPHCPGYHDMIAIHRRRRRDSARDMCYGGVAISPRALGTRPHACRMSFTPASDSCCILVRFRSARLLEPRRSLHARRLFCERQGGCGCDV